MSIKNRYISVKSPFESELVQSLLFEAGAGWQYIGKKTLLLNSCIIVINDRLEMYTMAVTPHNKHKELSLLELINIVRPDAPEKETLYICEVVDNHISFEGAEVALTPDELSEVLRVIESLSHRDFEITTADGGDRVFPLANLTIHFK